MTGMPGADLALPFLLIVNLFTYALYAQDKRAAQKGGWRVPEATLLLLALLGGTPAALIASRRFRHKTKKASFRLRMIVILLLQGTMLAAWLISEVL